MPVDHYENFPVASWLLPARLRPPIEAVYAFARAADDIADEGDLADSERLAGLERCLRALDEIERGGVPAEAPFARLAAAVREHDLPLGLLRDLVDAFSQDVVKKRYETYEELLDYSRRSANPVGRLVLHLMGRDPGCSASPMFSSGVPSPALLRHSDAICSALQFVNFWQDVAIDWARGRIYVPREDLDRFGVEEAHFEGRLADAAWRALMEFESRRTRALLDSGWPLAEALPGRLGLEIRATVHGGRAILDKIDAAGGDVFQRRPALARLDWVRIVVMALARRPGRVAGPPAAKTTARPR